MLLHSLRFERFSPQTCMIVEGNLLFPHFLATMVKSIDISILAFNRLSYPNSVKIRHMKTVQRATEVHTPCKAMPAEASKPEKRPGWLRHRKRSMSVDPSKSYKHLAPPWPSGLDIPTWGPPYSTRCWPHKTTHMLKDVVHKRGGQASKIRLETCEFKIMIW